MADIDPYANPDRKCDLIMKGGIASGMVYPSAVLELAKTYRFCGIGGTSVGAIAAGLVAAAEYGRDSGGFDKLKTLSDWLGVEGNLRSLFQADAEVMPLMQIALDVLGRPGTSKPEGIGGTIRNVNDLLKKDVPASYSDGQVVGLGVGIIASLLLTVPAALVANFAGGSLGLAGWLAMIAVPGVILGTIGGFLGGIVGAGRNLYEIVFNRLPKRGFGLCSGLTVGDGPAEGLTDWLHGNLNRLAGLEGDQKVLTFGMIRKKGEARGVPFQLAMMTTDLNHQAPWRLPFNQNIFLFEESELRELFPAEVVAHMVAHAHVSDRHTLPDGIHFLPEPDELPAVFGARLSLSLPILFRAVKLYAIAADAYARKPVDGKFQITDDDLQICWFSDGGIVSNFPIHFFDRWLPNWPTFGINLGDLPPDAMESSGGASTINPRFRSEIPHGESISPEPSTTGANLEMAETQAAARRTVLDVDLPKASSVPSLDWGPIETLGDLGSAIFYAAKNHSETIQSTLPSYRDRIVQVRLSADEGGMNLDMPPAIIRSMVDKGSRAGILLRESFRFDYHRWVRFRVLMAHLEEGLREFDAVLRETDYPDVIRESSEPGRHFPYFRPKEWTDQALDAVEKLQVLVHAWPPPEPSDGSPRPGFFDDDKTPKPRSVLRITPRD